MRCRAWPLAHKHRQQWLDKSGSRWLVNGVLQLGHGGLVMLFAAAKAFDQLHIAAHLAEGLHLQNVVIFNGKDAFIGVFVDQGFQDFACGVAILGIDAIVLQFFLARRARSLRVSRGWS